MKIYPERLPDYIINDPRKTGECKVYEALQKLPDPYLSFYSVAWQVRSPKTGAKDGEADFIIAHPELGIMILEVKGGQVRYESNTKLWFSQNLNGKKYEIKDAVEQARNSKGALLTKLKDLPGWDPNLYLTIAYMAVFPDTFAENTYFRPDLPRQIIIDASDLDHIEEKIEQGFSWYYGEEKNRVALGKKRLSMLEDLLGRSFTLRTTLGVMLEEEDSQIIELTEDQMRLLHFIQGQRRALIEGCAGSGKTLLALEKARLLANEGFNTLLLCFNAPLADFLKQRAPEGVEVFHFHGLCKKMASEAGLGYRSYNSEDEYYNKILPDMLLEAVLELGPQYDAIIVDEGQDFLETWWEILFALLRDPTEGIFYVFYDSNQNIYHRQKTLGKFINNDPYQLTENCRNTVAIHQIVKELHQDSGKLTCRGPLGRAPEIIYFSSPEEQEQLVQKVLQRLVGEEKVSAKNIVLLTSRTPENTSFHTNKRLENFQLTEWVNKPMDKNLIQVSSVHRFKGLDSQVVILTGLEDNDPDWLIPVLYVACSRARTHLIIVAHERSGPQMKAILKSARGAL